MEVIEFFLNLYVMLVMAWVFGIACGALYVVSEAIRSKKNAYVSDAPIRAGVSVTFIAALMYILVMSVTAFILGIPFEL